MPSSSTIARFGNEGRSIQNGLSAYFHHMGGPTTCGIVLANIGRGEGRSCRS